MSKLSGTDAVGFVFVKRRYFHILPSYSICRLSQKFDQSLGSNFVKIKKYNKYKKD